ncbi:hypothetical protein HUJ05_007217 [Dendroctonus ponderosae]|nr:hypothetical protein HUJ05_007217 [Dendroctonus ponderosae]
MRKMRLLISCLLLGLANAGEYSERFLTLYNQIVDSNNGYYSSHGVPYHSLENMLVETVDHGHETDSEAISYNIWLHAMYGAIADDFAPFNNAWSVIENYLIPQAQYNMDKVLLRTYVQNKRMQTISLSSGFLDDASLWLHLAKSFWRESKTGYTFHGLYYENEPLDDDGTSDWFGMWSWTTDRLAQYYYITGDETARSVLEKWFTWLYQHMTVSDNSYSVPMMISWSGSLPTNAKMNVLESGSRFFGVGSSIARSLSYYAAKSGDSKAKSTAKQLLDVIWKNHKDSKGLYVRSDLSAFTAVNTKVYIPVDGWTGTYPNGDKITASSSFLDIRSWYKQDENWPQLQAYLNGGSAPVVDYHRFWEQADMALALGAYSLLFE